MCDGYGGYTWIENQPGMILILRRLSSYSGTNRMYQAFCELGRAVRTIFLLEYISDIDLRRKIQSATNISESWNGFLQWACFGGENIGGLARDSQQKAIRYNHLVGNLVVYYNVAHLTRVLQDWNFPDFVEPFLKLSSHSLSRIRILLD